MGLTGPAAAAVTTLVQEYELMFKYVNEVEGGIDGMKLDWKVVDHKGTADGTLIAYKDLRDSYKPAVFLTEADYYLVGSIPLIAEDKSTFISSSALNNKTVIPPGRFFSYGIPTADGFAAYVNNLLANWKGTGKPKVGVLYWDLASGQAWRAAEGYVRAKGVDLVPATYSMTSIDFKPQLLQFKEAKVDAIWVMATTQQAVLVVRDARGVGIAPSTVTFQEFVEAETLLSLVGAQAEGFTAYMHESPYSDNTEAAKLYTAMYKFAGKENKWSDNRGVIFIKAVLTAALKQAAADVGKDKINSDAVYNALNKMPKIDTWGNAENFGYGPAKRVGPSAIKMRQYTATGTKSMGDWIPTPRIYEGVDK